MKTLWIAFRVTLVTLAVTGLAYPALVTVAAKLLFPAQAEGSLVRDGQGRVIGSVLIAQAFTAPGYFQPRPSAAGSGYDAAASSGSNLGPTSQKLRDRVAADTKRLTDENPGAGPVPAELVTTSGSGLDPHISPDAARWQLPRVARARNVPQGRIQPVLDRMVEGRDLGFLGERRVNVLLLNLEVDKLLGPPPR